MSIFRPFFIFSRSDCQFVAIFPSNFPMTPRSASIHAWALNPARKKKNSEFYSLKITSFFCQKSAISFCAISLTALLVLRCQLIAFLCLPCQISGSQREFTASCPKLFFRRPNTHNGPISATIAKHVGKFQGQNERDPPAHCLTEKNCKSGTTEEIGRLDHTTGWQMAHNSQCSPLLDPK